MAVAVVALRDGFVFVLSGSVPDLQLDACAVDGHDFVGEVDADGHHVVVDELPLAVPQQDVALPHSRLPNYDDLLQVVERLLASHALRVRPHYTQHPLTIPNH